jgi:ABC-type Fe3+ transport system permease subunit
VSVLLESRTREFTKPVGLKKFQLPKVDWSSILAIVLIGFLILLLAYPIGLLFVKSFVASRPGHPTVWTIRGWTAAFTDARLPVALGNTFFLAFARVVITSALAIFFAWVVIRTDTPLKGFHRNHALARIFLAAPADDHGLDSALGSSLWAG